MLNFPTTGEVKDHKARFQKFKGMPVEYIDGIPTAIKSKHRAFRKGFLISSELKLTPCYVASFHKCFAHGETLKEALEEARNKFITSQDLEDRMRLFEKKFKKDKKYKNSEFFNWHNYLTGSCLMGRQDFCRAHNVNLEAESTPLEFIKLCENDFGGEIIKKLYTKRSGDGSGDGSGYGSGYGSGSGYGYGDGSGSGSGSGYGYGSK